MVPQCLHVSVIAAIGYSQYFGESLYMMKRSVNLVFGILLVIAGLIVMPMPVPLGLIMIILGLSLMVSAWPALQRKLKALRSRFRKISDKLSRIRHRLPGFARRLLDDTEPD
ncbi:MAG: PGPGW domain-containing protein [Thalassolituus sp.]|mgnify:FL=1|jgi:hypothetical protein|uniref:Transmembrane protein (PGPGW) n=1 Tax=hydrothermal vent metagenome TaxID=652676 RepID=A0A160TFC5_9ZZZZ|nr:MULTISPECIES: PGPGW domain-containing protein [Thalassolituus]PCI49055.1 MAG: hypothetical protein COB43_05840 [Oceanospirillales bacterium]PHQ85427.1 MAG: hypothetical protein COB58_09325 [Thalassobium sp.]APR66927.1 hypothetical protein CN03_08270 [Thalassolituus oleivorans]MBQ0781118.1 hypothetical protein [Thalassolituus oleivorans]MCA6128830.1 hypothetical protein [Thalassolituus oleivorans 4BN06-13]